jgi:hypothetical protein
MRISDADGGYRLQLKEHPLQGFEPYQGAI